jgi:uncharacterized protein with HEPN domain
MTLEPKMILRLQFLSRVVRKECQHLVITDSRLFKDIFTLEQVKQLKSDIELAEQVEAFIGRFGRLQDTLGDKLLPQLLMALGERTASAIDNFDLAERLGFINSVNQWMTMRNLRNQMVHEYIEDPVLLANALQSGHLFVPNLIIAADKMLAEIEQRGWM